jgi:hypothetical protein
VTAYACHKGGLRLQHTLALRLLNYNDT